MSVSQPKKYLCKAVYTGRRLSNGKVWQRFELLPEKTEMFFKGVKQVYLGYTYKCNKNSISGKPERTDDSPVHDAKWDAEDALVDAYNASRRAESKIRASTSPALKGAIQALKPLVRNISFFESRNLIDFLVQEAKRK